MKILLLVFVLVTNIFCNTLSFDFGQTQAVFNRFAIPNTSDNRVSLPTDDTLNSYRITGYFDLVSGNQIYFLFAPLETTYNFDSKNNFEFDGENYTANTDTEVYYKFNSYRLGYIWNFGSESFKYWFGAVGKIRDAKISVEQGTQSNSFDNIGFVPLIAIGFEAQLLYGLSLFSHTDALGSSQGSAYDSQLELRYKFGSVSTSVGKRILGGGADNDNVYNFAQFDTNYLRVSFHY